MRILHLTFYRKWFDLIAIGKKVIEYLGNGRNGEVLAGKIILIFIGRRIRFENYQIGRVRLCTGFNKAIPYESSLCDECKEQLNQSGPSWDDDPPIKVSSNLSHSDHTLRRLI